jgi:hypothetical protein
MEGKKMMDAFRIVVRHCSEPLDSPTCTIAELPDGISLDRAREIYHTHFLKYASDDIVVELFRDEVVLH